VPRTGNTCADREEEHEPVALPGWTRTVAALVALAALLGACGSSGGPLDAAALDQHETTLHGLAGEGSLMATATEKGDLLGPFRRVHSRELADEAGLAADALDAEVADQSLADRQHQLQAEATAIAEAFIALSAPSVDPEQARRVNEAFERSASSTS
jgi:hypothetical protein